MPREERLVSIKISRMYLVFSETYGILDIILPFCHYRSVWRCRCRQDCVDYGADQQRGQGPWWLLCVCRCGGAYPRGKWLVPWNDWVWCHQPEGHNLQGEIIFFEEILGYLRLANIPCCWLLLLGRPGVRTDERAPRCPCQSGSDWTDCSRVLPWSGGSGCAALHWQHLQIHTGWFWGAHKEFAVDFNMQFPFESILADFTEGALDSQVSALLGRIPSAVGYQPTLATDMGTMQERITTTKKGSITSVQVTGIRRKIPSSVQLLNSLGGSWNFVSGYLCASWWLDWPCPRHHLRSLGRYYCVVACHRWAGYLPCRRPSGLHLPYHGPQHCRIWALWCCPWCAENPSGWRLVPFSSIYHPLDFFPLNLFIFCTGLQVPAGYHCHSGYGWVVWGGQTYCGPCSQDPAFPVPALPGCWGLHWPFG